AGTDVQMVQATDYPWDGKVSITVNPATPKTFTVKVRIPKRNVSELYTSTPDANGVSSIALNGQTVTPAIDKGYAVFNREWKAGDKIELVLPLKIQRVKAGNQIAADRGRVALRYGPLVYNLESVDQDLAGILESNSPLTTEWQPDLLKAVNGAPEGVIVIKGSFATGSPLLAIPNYARNNRKVGAPSIVWAKDQ
ncbi:MAG: hypothetical protein DVB25_01320, partial [Verrucomicrobia bacterium]